MTQVMKGNRKVTISSMALEISLYIYIYKKKSNEKTKGSSLYLVKILWSSVWIQL